MVDPAATHELTGCCNGAVTLAGGECSLPSCVLLACSQTCRVGFIDGLQLGGLIGRGGYARVYKGGWASGAAPCL